MSKDDIERVQRVDEIEWLAATMKSKPGYGYFNKDQRHM